MEYGYGNCESWNEKPCPGMQIPVFTGDLCADVLKKYDSRNAYISDYECR